MTDAVIDWICNRISGLTGCQTPAFLAWLIVILLAAWVVGAVWFFVFFYLYDKPHQYLTWRNPWEWTKWIVAIGLLALFFPIGFAAFFEINKEYDAILRRCYAEVEDSLRRQGKLKE